MPIAAKPIDAFDISITESPTMFYSASSLDRADHLRKDNALIQTMRFDANTRLVPVCQGKSLVSAIESAQTSQALVLASKQLPDTAGIFLGTLENTHYFAVDVSELPELDRDRLCAEAFDRSGMLHQGVFMDLRQIGPTLSPEDGSLLAYARALAYWNSTTIYCTRCAHKLESSNAGHTKTCANPDCGHLAFPRTDPAVIMLVIHTPEDNSQPMCLLGRHAAWPKGVFSTLAGFVEPGESLEMAVSREVLEEASILTTDARYIASQPWPFPRSIMLGFTAVATSTEIQCDPDELEDARWFTRAQLKTFGDWGDEGDGYKLPRPDSIARYLIDRWINAG